jgi:hypothetical protein
VDGIADRLQIAYSPHPYVHLLREICDIGALQRMRRKKNVCRAPRCSANSLSMNDGCGSVAAMVTSEISAHSV